jgi:hypothetical protein
VGGEEEVAGEGLKRGQMSAAVFERLWKKRVTVPLSMHIPGVPTN